MAWDTLAISAVCVGALYLVAAASLFLLAPGNRGNRTYALVVFLYGFDTACVGIGLGLDPGFSSQLAFRLSGYASWAEPFAILYFLLNYPRRPEGLPRVVSHPAWFLLATITIVGLWMLRGSPMGPTDFNAANPAEPVWAATLVGLAEDPILGLGAWLFVRRATHAPGEILSRSLMLIGVGLLGYVTWNAAEALPTAIANGTAAKASGVAIWDDIIQILFVAATVGELVAARRRKIAAPVRFVFAIIGFAIVSGLLSSPAVVGRWAPTVYGISFAIWVTLQPTLVIYTILRHQFFDIDVKIRWTVKRGAIALPIIAVFVVGSQIAEAFAATFFGGQSWAAGALAAGVMLLFLQPLQRWADRFSRRAVAGPVDFDSMTVPERHAFYQQQFLFALSDGGISRDERRMLDFARKRLAIPPEEARRLEASVVGSA